MFDPAPIPAPEPVIIPPRDPLVDRARAVYLYVVSVIALVQGVVLPILNAFGLKVETLPLAVLAILVTPAVVFMFGKSLEQALAKVKS